MHRFDIKLLKIQFRDCMKQQTPLKISLLQDSQLLDQTNELMIKPDQKIVNLQKEKNLLFFSKEQTINSPVYIQIFIGAKIKKALIRRVDQLRQFQKGKSLFSLNQDFGTFKFAYEVNISQEKHNNNFLSIKKVQITKPQIQKVQNTKLQNAQKVQNTKQPKVETIKIQQSKQQSSQLLRDSKISFQEENSQLMNSKMRKRPSKLATVQNVASKIRDRSLSKGEKKVNQKKQNKQTQKQEQFIIIHKTQSATEGQLPQTHISQGPFFASLKSSQRHSQRIQNAANQLITTHHPKIDEHNSHDGAHGAQKLSIKLKIVILMLLFGFLFLMYDALDDRFSQRKVLQQSLGRLQKLTAKKHKKKKKII